MISFAVVSEYAEGKIGEVPPEGLSDSLQAKILEDHQASLSTHDSDCDEEEETFAAKAAAATAAMGNNKFIVKVQIPVAHQSPYL